MQKISLSRRVDKVLWAACSALACLLCIPAQAVAAPFEDSMAQRTMACTACHGEQGRAAPDGYYPRLAGKPAGYLYKQLINFREGRRHYGLMTQLIAPLSDAYLMEIAQYFSDLNVPYPAPAPAIGSRQTLEHGKNIVLQGDAARQLPACVQCHGQAMTGVNPDVPGLLGLPRDYLSAQLGAWQSGQRRAHAPDCMKAVMTRLSPQDIEGVVNWLAAQPLPANPHPVNARPALAAGSVPMDCAPMPLKVQP